jgi:hypothetical protein
VLAHPFGSSILRLHTVISYSGAQRNLLGAVGQRRPGGQAQAGAARIGCGQAGVAVGVGQAGAGFGGEGHGYAGPATGSSR